MNVYCVDEFSHKIIASWLRLSFKTTVNYIEWSDSRRVVFMLSPNDNIQQAGIVFHSNE